MSDLLLAARHGKSQGASQNVGIIKIADQFTAKLKERALPNGLSGDIITNDFPRALDQMN